MNHTFDRLIALNCPGIYSHLRNQDMKTEYFTFKWSMTLFSCALPEKILPHIYDLFLVSGWRSVYSVGVSLTKNFMKDKLMTLEGMMEISSYIREDLRATETYTNQDIHKIIMGSHDININTKDLSKFKDEFYVGLAK